jgi:hypothetical protein
MASLANRSALKRAVFPWRDWLSASCSVLDFSLSGALCSFLNAASARARSFEMWVIVTSVSASECDRMVVSPTRERDLPDVSQRWMVVNKSNATNNSAPAAKEKYVASTATLATVRLFVTTISCAGKNSHHVGSDIGAREDQTKQSSLFFKFSGSQLGPKKMGYGLTVAIISAQARATVESGEADPGIVAHPPFSTNVPRSQA